MDDRNLKPENITEPKRWHSRHQRAEDLSGYSLERWQSRADPKAMFVARGSGRIHDATGDGVEDGEWRIDAWPEAPLNGPEALLLLSLPWVDDIAQSATMDSLGGVALDLASCERLAEAAAHAAAVLRAGQWVPRPVLASQGPVFAAEVREVDQARRELAEQRQLVANLQAELAREREKASRKPVPHVTAQAVLDAGINVFGLQLVLESLGEGALTFDLTHRGRLWRIALDSAASEEPKP
jgi:hypothetical protein